MKALALFLAMCFPLAAQDKVPFVTLRAKTASASKTVARYDYYDKARDLRIKERKMAIEWELVNGTVPSEFNVLWGIFSQNQNTKRKSMARADFHTVQLLAGRSHKAKTPEVSGRFANRETYAGIHPEDLGAAPVGWIMIVTTRDNRVCASAGSDAWWAAKAKSPKVLDMLLARWQSVKDHRGIPDEPDIDGL